MAPVLPSLAVSVRLARYRRDHHRSTSIWDIRSTSSPSILFSTYHLRPILGRIINYFHSKCLSRSSTTYHSLQPLFLQNDGCQLPQIAHSLLPYWSAPRYPLLPHLTPYFSGRTAYPNESRIRYHAFLCPPAVRPRRGSVREEVLAGMEG